MLLRNAILRVQELGQRYDFTIIVIGGAIVRLIGKKTAIKKIDEQTIFIEYVENPNTTRPEDAKTIVDIDCIAFSNAEDPFTREVKNNFSSLYKEVLKLREDQTFPAVSLEPVLYHPYFSKPNQLTQFVSSIESYHNHDFFFRLGSAKKDVSPKSLMPWTYVCTDTNDKIVSLSPIALQLRYNIRGFAIKPKDREKIWGTSSFAKFVVAFNAKTKGVYQKEYTDWEDFAQVVQQAKQPSMRLKRGLWNLYWQTIGTYLAHGSGRLGKLLLPLGNTLFAGK